MSIARFDLHALFESVDGERKKQGLSWAALSRQIGVAASTLQRYSTADDAEADGVLLTIRWLGTTPEDHIENGQVVGTRLHPIGSGQVRVDMERIAAANDDPLGANSRTRTTIQRLVAAADRSNQPVASLTRIAEV